MVFATWQYVFTGFLFLAIGFVQSLAPIDGSVAPQVGVTPTKAEIATRSLGLVMIVMGMGSFLRI